MNKFYVKRVAERSACCKQKRLGRQKNVRSSNFQLNLIICWRSSIISLDFWAIFWYLTSQWGLSPSERIITSELWHHHRFSIPKHLPIRILRPIKSLYWVSGVLDDFRTILGNFGGPLASFQAYIQGGFFFGNFLFLCWKVWARSYVFSTAGHTHHLIKTSFWNP